MKSGTKSPHSVLSEKEQAIVCEFRRMIKLSLDDIYADLKTKIAALNRSNLHRCFKKNGLSRQAPEAVNGKKERKNFKSYEIGFFHIDIAQIYTAEGKSYLFVTIDRKSRYVFAALYSRMDTATIVCFLRNIIANIPFKIHTILTDNGVKFSYKMFVKHLLPENKSHPFDVICEGNIIEHRLTEFRHPWTNGLGERMNSTIKDETVKIYFYETLSGLRKYLSLWLLAYNIQRKLKSLHYSSPYDILCYEF